MRWPTSWSPAPGDEREGHQPINPSPPDKDDTSEHNFHGRTVTFNLHVTNALFMYVIRIDEMDG